MTSSPAFTPMAMKGIILLSSPEMTGPSDVASFGSELTVLANSLKDRFSLAEKVGPEAGNKMLFAYTMPSETLAPGITRPEGIRGKTLEVPITDWSDVTRLIESLMDVAY